MHARGFDEARYTTSHPVMEETLARIQLLYDIEDRAKELTAPERHAASAGIATNCRPTVRPLAGSAA